MLNIFSVNPLIAISFFTGLVIIFISVCNLKIILNYITKILLELWEIELNNNETRMLLLIIGLLIVVFCGLSILNISSIAVCILGIIIGSLLIYAAAFNKKIILALLVIPNIWLSSFSDITLRTILGVFGITILIASIVGIIV